MIDSKCRKMFDYYLHWYMYSIYSILFYIILTASFVGEAYAKLNTGFVLTVLSLLNNPVSTITNIK